MNQIRDWVWSWTNMVNPPEAFEEGQNTADEKHDQQFFWGRVLGGMIGRDRFDAVLEAANSRQRKQAGR